MHNYPWLAPIWQSLVQRHQGAGLPHALMLVGTRGVGKHSLAQSLSQWLLCDTAQQQKLPQACGQCHSCQLYRAGSHPDFMYCTTEEKSKQIKVDNIRAVNGFLAQTPQIGRTQVVVIRPIEVMNTNAANALLKTLEEPAGNSYLILEAERYGSVLPTIRSRCQRVVIPAPSMEEGISWLTQQGQTPEQAQLALQINQAAPLAALHWLEHDNAPQQQWLAELGQWSRGEISLGTISENWNKLELSDVTYWFYLVLLDLLKVSLGVDATWQSFNGQVAELYQGATFDKIKLLTLQAKVQSVLVKLLAGTGNYNKQLLCESLLLDWQSSLKRE